MYNEQLEKLIEIALVDGEITEEEKQVLFKKAEQYGIDLDEFKMVLDSRLFEIKRNSNITNTPGPNTKSNKFGDIRKCPSCGASVNSFSSKCAECGHEFTGIQALSSKQKLYDQLTKIDSEERARSKNGFLQIMQMPEISIRNSQATAISSFPLPNTKEDILEFFNWAIHESNKKIGVGDDGTLNRAWRSKANELKLKISLDLANDPHAQLLLKEFEKSKKKIVLAPQHYAIVGIVVSLIILLSLISYFGKSTQKEIEKEQARLENIIKDINKEIEKKNYDAALIKASTLKWEYKESYSHSEKEYLPLWDQKRTELMNAIKDAQTKSISK